MPSLTVPGYYIGPTDSLSGRDRRCTEVVRITYSPSPTVMWTAIPSLPPFWTGATPNSRNCVAAPHSRSASLEQMVCRVCVASAVHPASSWWACSKSVHRAARVSTRTRPTRRRARTVQLGCFPLSREQQVRAPARNVRPGDTARSPA